MEKSPYRDFFLLAPPVPLAPKKSSVTWKKVGNATRAWEEITVYLSSQAKKNLNQVSIFGAAGKKHFESSIN